MLLFQYGYIGQSEILLEVSELVRKQTSKKTSRFKLYSLDKDMDCFSKSIEDVMFL